MHANDPRVIPTGSVQPASDLPHQGSSFSASSPPPAERLAEGEFIKGVIENDNAMRLIHYEPVK